MLFGALRWAAARNFYRSAGVGVPTANVGGIVTVCTPAAAQWVTHLGAGIYEEVLSRLGLFSVA